MIGGPFAREAPLELLREPAPLQRRIWEEVDAFISIWSPENAREGADLSEERQAALQQMTAPMRERTMSMAGAVGDRRVPGALRPRRRPGMTLAEFEEFIFDAVLLDWDAEGERMRGIADVFDAADEVRIVGRRHRPDAVARRPARSGRRRPREHAGRRGLLLAGRGLRGGRRSSSASSRPSTTATRSTGARFVFERGRIVDASARAARSSCCGRSTPTRAHARLGELGIGCNPGIQRFMKNVAFDEKIDGTVHLAVGNSYTFNGGTNESAIHWDIVKDLRSDG